MLLNNILGNGLVLVLSLGDVCESLLLDPQMNIKSREWFLQSVILLPLGLQWGPSVIFSIKKGPVLY